MADTTKPTTTFTANGLSEHSISISKFLSQNPTAEYDAVAGAALVFHKSPKDNKDRILLLQRSAHDSYPSHWEVPGGAIDIEDETILHGVARELFEEAGLTAEKFIRLVRPGQIFSTTSQRRVIKFSFEVEVKETVGVEGSEGVAVKLDPNEHQAWMWVTREEFEARKVEECEFKITTAGQVATILDGFNWRRNDQEGSNDGEPL